MKTALATAVFILNIEGTVHMGNIFKDILDALSTPEEPVKAEPKSNGLGARNKSSGSFGEAFAAAREEQGGGGGVFDYKGKSYTTNIAGENPVAKLYKAVVTEQNKDDRGNTPVRATTSVAYSRTSDDEKDLLNQGYYPDKIIRDSMRSGKLGSSTPRRNVTKEALDDIEAEIEKSRRSAARSTSTGMYDIYNSVVASEPSYKIYEKDIERDITPKVSPRDFGAPPKELRGDAIKIGYKPRKIVNPDGIDPFKYDNQPSLDPEGLMAPPTRFYDNWVDAAAQRIIQLEGFIGKAKILPGEKLYTLGHGRSDKTVKLGDEITKSDALAELKTDLMPKKIKVAKSLFPLFDTYSPNLKIELLQGVYRGNFKRDHEAVKLINNGEWEKAAVEFLDYQEYRDAKKIGSKRRGIVFRMDSIADALKDEVNNTANTVSV